MQQRIITEYSELSRWIVEKRVKTVLMVCDSSIKHITPICQELKAIEAEGTRLIYFGDFKPNPEYESVVKGVELFRGKFCDAIVAIGGGSAIDVAKCVKAYAAINGSGENGGFLKCDITPNEIPLLAIPTTAGTGSEATRYAVIYFDGKKQSVTSEYIIPETVLLNPAALKTLPMYQRKATMLDALCHAIESFWSVNSTEESKKYSKDAIRLILSHMEGYLQNTDEGNQGILMAANMAGKAINITQTTAGHAMSYKLTSLYGIAHGHAAALCMSELWPYTVTHTEMCVDPRGTEYLSSTLDEIAEEMGFDKRRESSDFLRELVDKLELNRPKPCESDFDILVKSVNMTRLKNNPVLLTDMAISEIYRRALASDRLV